jgi:hypothetical protein
MDKVFDKIVFVTHPTWPAKITAPKERRYSPTQIRHFIERRIMPAVRSALKEPKTLVVFIKTPHVHSPGKLISEFDYIDFYKPTELEKLAKRGGFDKASFESALKEVSAKEAISPRARNVKKSKLSLMRRVNKVSVSRHRKTHAVERDFGKVLEADFGQRAIIISGNERTDTTFVSQKIREALAKRGFRLDQGALAKGYGAWRSACATDYPKSFLEGRQKFRLSRKGTLEFDKPTIIFRKPSKKVQIRNTGRK